MLKIYDTTRLFYNKYAYKLTLSFPIGTIFRDKNWKWARTVLDAHINNDTSKNTLGFFRYNNYPDEDYVVARQMFNILQGWTDDYLIRIEHPKLNLYTSNTEYKDIFLCRFNHLIKEFHQPVDDELYKKLTNNQNILIENSDKWKFQIELEYGVPVSENLKNLKDKEQIYFRNKKIVRVIKVKNEKTLLLVQLTLQNHIKKIYTIERG
jgi:hypothetical protein